MSSSSRSSSEKLRTALLLLALVTQAGCAGPRQVTEAPLLPEQTPRKELFWRERLSTPPIAKPPPLSATEQQRVLALSIELGVADVTALDPILRALVKIGPGSIPLLVQQLMGAHPEAARRNLVLALTALGDPAGAGPLAGLLRDPSAEVALLAARGLGRLAVPWTLPRLIKAVGRYDVTPWLIVRVEAAGALLRFQNYSGVEFLFKVLKEHTALEDKRQREWGRRLRIVFEKEAAARALRGLIGADHEYSPNGPYPRQERAILEMESWWKAHRNELWDSAPPLTDPELLRRVGWLADGLSLYQIRTVDNARFILKSLGPPALSAFQKHLRDPRFYVRLHLLEALAQMGDTLSSRSEELARLLEPHLSDPEPAIRTQAVKILGTAKVWAGPDPMARLVAALSDPDGSVRATAIRSLGLTGQPAAAVHLRPLAHSGSCDDSRANARAALFRLGHHDLLDRLLEDLLDPGLKAQASALEALGWLGAPIAEFPLGAPEAARDPYPARFREALKQNPPD